MTQVPSSSGESNAPALAWSDIWRQVLMHRKRVASGNVIAIFAALASVPVPLLIPLLVDEVVLQQPGALVGAMNQVVPQPAQGPVIYVGLVLTVTLALRALALVLNVWQTRQFTLIAKDVTFQLRRQLLARLERVAMDEYEAMGTSRVTSHFVTDLNVIDEFLGITVGRCLVAVLTLCGTAAVLLWMHWPLGLFILCLNPLVIYFTTRLGKRVKELKRLDNAAVELFQQALTDTLDAIQEVRTANRERHYFQGVEQQARNVRDKSAGFGWQSDAANRLSFLIFVFGIDCFRAISILLVVFSDLSIGQMMAVFGYLWFMMGPVQEVLNVQFSYFGARAALGRVNELLGLREEPRYPATENPFAGAATAALQIDTVSFAYRDGPLVLDRVSMEVAAGERVAIVGTSGGGKSTLVQVILGLYPALGGDIRFNGVSMRRIGLQAIRENVAAVLQHPALFNDTVRANLTLGRDVPDAVLWQALRIAELDGVVDDMAQGLDSVVGRQGVRLSGGQRQRVALARMVLSEPKVVILDESTSALDAETEAAVHRNLAQFLDGRTTLIVAHRLSAVRQADRIVVFDGGNIIEEGHHDNLLELDGTYARLYAQQV